MHPITTKPGGIMDFTLFQLKTKWDDFSNDFPKDFPNDFLKVFVNEIFKNINDFCILICQIQNIQFPISKFQDLTIEDLVQTLSPWAWL